MRISEILFSFEGRINRTQFWIAYLGMWLTVSALFAAGTLLHLADGPTGKIVCAILGGLILFVFLWTMLAVTTKRWHDMDRSAMWNLLWFIPYLGGLIVTIWLGTAPGSGRSRRRHH